MIHSYQIIHNKETCDFNGHNAQQFIVTLGTNAEAGDVEGILEQLFQRYLSEKEKEEVMECERVAYDKESWFCLTHNQLEEREESK
jgi:hypothetical protein